MTDTDTKEEVKGGDELKDNNDDEKKEQKEVKYIKFKWDKSKNKDKRECDTKHMLFLLHLALKKVEQRTKEKNEQFRNYGRTDRILKDPDYNQILTNFVNWHLEKTEENKFDGKYLDKTPRIECTNTIKKVGQVKEGWAIKIYKYLKKDIMINTNWKECKIPNYQHISIGMSIELLTLDEMIFVMENYVFKHCQENAKKGDWKLKQHQENILKFMKEENMTGQKFDGIKKNQFKDTLRSKYLGDNKKLNGPISKMYTVIEKCPINEVLKK